MPVDWIPGDQNLADASRRGLSDEEIAVEATRFRDYHHGKGVRSSDWDAKWRNWLWRRGDFGPLRADGHRAAFGQHTEIEEIKHADEAYLRGTH